MRHEEYESAALFALYDVREEIAIPAFGDLERGGIVGEVEIVDCVQASESPWFFGPWGFVLRNPKPLPFRPWGGTLGFFHVEEQR